MSRLDPTQTFIRIPDEILWHTAPDAPPRSVAQAVLAGEAEPAVIAVMGIGPVDQTWVDPTQPWLRSL